MGVQGTKTRYSDDLVRPAMVAMFRVGKFYNKIFTPIGEDQVKFTKIAMKWYQAVVDYCQDNPDQKETAAVELDKRPCCVDIFEKVVQQIYIFRAIGENFILKGKRTF